MVKVGVVNETAEEEGHGGTAGKGVECNDEAIDEKRTEHG